MSKAIQCLEGAAQWVEWVALVVILVLLLTGCATLTPAQESALADWKGFAHRVTQHYGKPDVEVMVGSTSTFGDDISVMRPNGVLVLAPSALEPPPPGRSKDFIFAHELGHWITGQFNCGPVCEKSANAAAVEILVVGRPGVWTERTAFNHSMSLLWAWKADQDSGRWPPNNLHPSMCQEIADLAARFPQYNGKMCDVGMRK